MQPVRKKSNSWDCKLIPMLNLPPTFLFSFVSPLLLLLLLIASSPPVSKAIDISLGSSLFASNLNLAWSSPNNTFSLRFLPINSAAYSLAITYGSIPTWKAGGDTAIVGPGAVFRLFFDGDLRLLSTSGHLLWSSNTSKLGVSHANIDDSGNLILSNGSTPVWSTFDHPSDTIVPSQNFSLGKVLTSGFYSFSLHRTGNLTLRWNNSVVYYSSRLSSSADVNLSMPYLGLQSIGVLSLYDPNLSKPMILGYTSDYGDSGEIFRFLKLDGDGNLRIYSSQNAGNGITAVMWTAVSDQCQVFGYCGNMGICSYNDTNPICGCPSNHFVAMDPNDSRKGCRLKKESKDCAENTTMLQLDHTLFLTYPPDRIPRVYLEDISDCKDNCLSGSCLASTSLNDGSLHCYMVLGFVSGYRTAALLSTSFVKVCQPTEPNSPLSSEEASTDHEKLKRIIALIVLGPLVGLALLKGSFWWWCSRKNPNFGSSSVQYALLDYATGAPVQFSYKQLEQATRGFKEKLGEGGFGSVYKGVLANKSLAAVKQLQGIEQGEKQFRMEVATISSTHHLNLVRLIGFCSEGRHRLLVYEFLKNGSLDSFLFATQNQSMKQLSWKGHFNIALGTAKGITYLHEECRDCIVHCDIKPENILLDDNLNARVSDFGLAKLINPKGHRHRSLASIQGTRGYLAPEWLANLPITSKSDVYSYGMVLLEIISGRRNFKVSKETNMKKFSAWAYEEFDQGNVTSIIDNRLAEVDMDQATRAIQVSFWCIQEQPTQRPTMGKVVQMLEGITEIEKPPAPETATEVLISGTSLLTASSISIIANSTTLTPSSPNHSSFVSPSTPRDPLPLSRIEVESPTSCLIQTQSSPMNN